MSQLHKALEVLSPKDYNDVPLDHLQSFLSDVFSNAELIANSVPPPPSGTPYESSQRTRTDGAPATCAADLTVSNVRRPPPPKEQVELQKAWGKPLKLGAKDAATGISVFKMAGNDRHGAWFARTSVHEGLGFDKWKRAMIREFPESLEIDGGPGVGSVRGIGGDRRLEDITVEGLGKLAVYQLSAQFPGPTAPREFITLLLTTDNGLGEASKIGHVVPRHHMVVSIPLTHPEAPARNGMVRGQYESVEMIREIPLPTSKPAASASTSNLLKHDRKKSRERGGTIGFAESRGPDAKGEKIDRIDDADKDDAETNPVEWIMITRSDPGGGIPRFMVERGTPSSIVQDAGKFLDWACAKDDYEDEQLAQASPRMSQDEHKFSISETNGIMAGVGMSIADRPDPATFRRLSKQNVDEQPGMMPSLADKLGPFVPDAMNPLQRSSSHSSSLSSSSIDSFASAEQFNIAQEGFSIDDSTPSVSQQSLPLTQGDALANQKLQKLEQKRQQLKDKADQARQKQLQGGQNASSKTAKEIEKATERHNRERKRQEEKYAKDLQKLEARRERETKKLLARQQKEAGKSALQKMQTERNEWKQRAELAEQENKLLKEQIGELQRENTKLVARLGKSDVGKEILKKVREEDGSRRRSGSVRSRESGGSQGKKEHEGSSLTVVESRPT
ncbi:hypothetical protein K458DRAFT_492672 [Lentithecium fluviatile CBS 122367]|uniref:DUF3074 domain-containing protein n=1 Tax=Lentithecium fluviatile CBS 122367 TaxID=1168545 RepID=A0A6G1ID53_9PLEO|nr:hypothetical protein K458DRAFT_492672 [Lentithecium fluviatile CBS 122367]